mmetsp:Transcript_22293/g.27260  ORF Transcript_22293/g.27260 Transcript_22293/m.27260 type:complete len:92 (+) Transcript_22293:42-317(+)
MLKMIKLKVGFHFRSYRVRDALVLIIDSSTTKIAFLFLTMKETVLATSKTTATRRIIDNELLLLQQVNKRATLMVLFCLNFALTLFFYQRK